MCVIADRRFTCGVVGPHDQVCQSGEESKMIDEVEVSGKAQRRG